MELRYLSELNQAGHLIAPGIASGAALDALRAEATRLAWENPRQAHGIRHLLRQSPVFAAWSRSADVRALLPPGMEPARAILFDKTSETNWKVAWHQDLTIPVREKREVSGYGPWSVKDGVAHVQPPIAILEDMITLRLHLDDTPQ